MKTASVSELKAKLSAYLREVRRGGEVQVLERGVPVARLVGTGQATEPDQARRQRLIRAGVLRPGTGNAGALAQSPPVKVGGADLSRALQEERGDRL